MKKKEIFNQLKTKVVKGAKTSAIKIEEAAKIGKLHIQILAENKKLNQAYKDIGSEYVKAINEDKIAELESRPLMKENLAKVKDTLAKIESLEIELSGDNAL